MSADSWVPLFPSISRGDSPITMLLFRQSGLLPRLRFVDPEVDTATPPSAFGYKQLLHEPFMGGGLWTSAVIPLALAYQPVWVLGISHRGSGPLAAGVGAVVSRSARPWVNRP